MKKTKITSAALGIAALVFISGCQVYVGNPPPPPEVSVEVVPAYYVWDGSEFVGEVNGGWFYFGPGGWIRCDAVVLDRFHGWQRYHSDWRAHMVINNRDHRLDRAHANHARVERSRVEQRRSGEPAPRVQHAQPQQRSQQRAPQNRQRDEKKDQ